MRAYRIELPAGAEIPRVVRFAGSMDDARRERTTIVNDRSVSQDRVTISEVDIPTSKAALLAFLNHIMVMA